MARYPLALVAMLLVIMSASVAAVMSQSKPAVPLSHTLDESQKWFAVCYIDDEPRSPQCQTIIKSMLEESK